MITDAPNLNILWAELIVEELIRNGVDHFIISPGSRSTPLTAAAARNPKAKNTVHFDERGAAFFALGTAKALGKPCALICTSGTAVANYFPAIVEASMSYVPLIVLTADRPPELQNTGANQTINQTNIYGEYVRHFVGMPCPSNEFSPGFVLTTIDHAVYSALQPPAGPVHINCAFREPLMPVAASLSDLDQDMGVWTDSHRPYTDCIVSSCGFGAIECQPLIQQLKATEKLLVVIGQDIADNAVIRNIEMSIHFRNTVVFADSTSSLRVKGDNATFANYDLLLRSPEFKRLCQPDAVIHLGGAIVSKRLQEHLSSIQPRFYLRVANHSDRHDPYHCVTHRFQLSLSDFFSAWGTSVVVPTEWKRKMMLAWASVQKVVADILDADNTISEPAIASMMGEFSHEHSDDAFFFGNSMPIRDFDAFSGLLSPSNCIIANRGASGIDGNIATAAGFSNASGRRVTAVIGDVATLHDLNSLLLLRAEGVRVTLIVINNNGGGIFHFLPIAEHTDVFEKYFGTPHGLHFEDAARMFGLPYCRPTTKAEFVEAYKMAQDSATSCIIEVITDREENLRLHRKISDAVVKALD